MNKTKTILAATGGVIGVAVLVMAYFTWDAFSRKSAAFEGDDENEGLETYVNRVATLLGKKPYPSLANKARLEANRKAVEQWRSDMWRHAGAGDWYAPKGVTTALFKEFLVREARRISNLPGQQGGKLVKPDFAFGPFKDYLGDKMPAKGDLLRLERQWYDITALCDLLATNGAAQIVDLKLVDRTPEAAPDKGPKANAKKRKKAAKPEVRQPAVETYTVTFQSNPESFVSIIRILSSQERFTIVDSFSFSHVRDAVSEALGGGGEKKEPAQAAPARRRGRRNFASFEPEKQPEPEKKNATVFDPEKDSLLQVELTVSVCDFLTLEQEDDKEEAK